MREPKAVDLEAEYLYTVKVTSTGEIKQAVARGMKGVALQLGVKDHEIIYVTKERVR